MSEGYPSMSVMKACLATKTIQSFISVTCEICFLVRYSNTDDPTSSAEAQALFYMNIISGVGVVVMDMLMLCMRGGMLRSMDPTTNAGRRSLEQRKSLGAALAAKIERESSKRGGAGVEHADGSVHRQSIRAVLNSLADDDIKLLRGSLGDSNDAAADDDDDDDVEMEERTTYQVNPLYASAFSGASTLENKKHGEIELDLSAVYAETPSTATAPAAASPSDDIVYAVNPLHATAAVAAAADGPAADAADADAAGGAEQDTSNI
jgi:hypothetical protein